MAFNVDIVEATFGILAVLGAAAFTGSVAAFRDKSDVIRRIRGASDEQSHEPKPGRSFGNLARHLSPLARLTGADQTEVSRLRVRLAWAGYRSEYAVQAFLASKMVLGVATLVAFAFLSTIHGPFSTNPLLLAVLSVGGAFFLPNLWLRARITARQGDIERALPDALDLLVTCVEAGLALDAAFQRVSSDLAMAAPTLAQEMNVTWLEVKAGVARTTAMRRLADRTGVADLRSLAATLNQTEMFGTSVSVALRVQAEGMRLRRTQRAEEKAAYLAVKMALPLALCLLPCLFAVILGPAVVNISRVLLNR